MIRTVLLWLIITNLLLVSCTEEYETVDCRRGGIQLVFVGFHDTSAYIGVEAYEKGSGFTKLIKQETFQRSKLSCHPINPLLRDTQRDTLFCSIMDSIPITDFTLPKPDQYDWRITNSSTRKVYLVTDINLKQPTTVKVKKGDPNPCFATVIDYKVNGVSSNTFRPSHLTSGGILIFANL